MERDDGVDALLIEFVTLGLVRTPVEFDDVLVLTSIVACRTPPACVGDVGAGVDASGIAVKRNPTILVVVLVVLILPTAVERTVGGIDVEVSARTESDGVVENVETRDRFAVGVRGNVDHAILANLCDVFDHVLGDGGGVMRRRDQRDVVGFGVLVAIEGFHDIAVGGLEVVETARHATEVRRTQAREHGVHRLVAPVTFGKERSFEFGVAHLGVTHERGRWVGVDALELLFLGVVEPIDVGALILEHGLVEVARSVESLAVLGFGKILVLFEHRTLRTADATAGVDHEQVEFVVAPVTLGGVGTRSRRRRKVLTEVVLVAERIRPRPRIERRRIGVGDHDGVPERARILGGELTTVGFAVHVVVGIIGVVVDNEVVLRLGFRARIASTLTLRPHHVHGVRVGEEVSAGEPPLEVVVVRLPEDLHKGVLGIDELGVEHGTPTRRDDAGARRDTNLHLGGRIVNLVRPDARTEKRSCHNVV